MKSYIIFILLVFNLVGQNLLAQHTFSIVAIDPATGAIGSAGATCLNTDDCAVCTAQIISDIVPGKGAINAQASVCIPNVNLENGITQIQAGANAQETLDWLNVNDACNSGNVTNRQYGIITIDDTGSIMAKSLTGINCLNEANHITGDNYSIQGNILIEENVLDSIEAGFLKPNLSFEEKLMAALQGANRPGADSRCLSLGISSKSAYLRVAYPDDAADDFTIDLLVSILPSGEEPIDALQILFDGLNISTVQDLKKKDEIFEVYPNPIHDAQVNLVTTLTSSINYNFELRDTAGKLIHVQNIEAPNTSLNFSALALQGAFIYTISDQKKQMIQSGRLIFVKE